MTSEEIKNENKLDSQYFWLWLKEIAYQLAVMNERRSEKDYVQGVTDGQNALMTAQSLGSERGELKTGYGEFPEPFDPDHPKKWTPMQRRMVAELRNPSHPCPVRPMSGAPRSDLAARPKSNREK